LDHPSDHAARVSAVKAKTLAGDYLQPIAPIDFRP
jgi:hypothetical protein